jgi:hypothetical protein
VPLDHDAVLAFARTDPELAAFLAEIPAPTPPAAPPAGSEVSLTGTVLDVSPSARIVTLAEPVGGFRVIALTEQGRVSSAAGEETLLRDLRPGMTVRASGRPGASGVLIAEQVLVPAD